MTFAYNEVVRSGNATARIKNILDNGFVVLMDINGEFNAGDTVTGDDSGYSATIKSVDINSDYDVGFTPTIWDDLLPIAITQDDGAWVVQDAHFTGKDSQDWQPDNVVTIDT